LVHSGFREIEQDRLSAARRPIRHSVAKWFEGRSLGAKLSFFVALIVFGVTTGVAYLEVRLLEGHVDGDLVDAARLGARSAADILAERALPFDPSDIRDALHDLVERTCADRHRLMAVNVDDRKLRARPQMLAGRQKNVPRS
jgi:hypothetical protein